MIVGVVKTAAAAATAALAASSANNIVQTYRISRNPACVPDPPKITGQTSAAVLDELRQMKRADLLQLFLSSEAPSGLSVIEGEWNGVLLENNGWLMSGVAVFLSNTLFGMGRVWNGKAFLADKLGINRFTTKDTQIELEHNFDYSIAPSGLGSSAGSSLRLKYSPYQFPLSLWKTMEDELRIIPVEDGQILLGMGHMAWSGGVLNCSPFALHRESPGKVDKR